MFVSFLGTALFWEFATDSYDIAFGLFFEWVSSGSFFVTRFCTNSARPKERISYKIITDFRSDHRTKMRSPFTSRIPRMKTSTMRTKLVSRNLFNWLRSISSKVKVNLAPAIIDQNALGPGLLPVTRCHYGPQLPHRSRGSRLSRLVLLPASKAVLSASAGIRTHALL